MNLNEIFPHKMPADSMPLEEGEIWGPIVIEDPRITSLILGSRLSIQENRVHWIGTDDFGRGFAFQGSPTVSEEGIIFRHGSDPVDILIRPLQENDWKYFGDGKVCMSLEEIYESADAMFLSC